MTRTASIAPPSAPRVKMNTESQTRTSWVRHRALRPAPPANLPPVGSFGHQEGRHDPDEPPQRGEADDGQSERVRHHGDPQKGAARANKSVRPLRNDAHQWLLGSAVASAGPAPASRRSL